MPKNNFASSEIFFPNMPFDVVTYNLLENARIATKHQTIADPLDLMQK